MEVLRFVFSNFWTFSGTVFIIAITLEGIEGIINALKK